MHLLYAVAAAVAAVALPIYYLALVPESAPLLNNKTLFEAVSRISDPEQLISVVRQISRDANAFFVTSKDMVEAAIILLAAVLGAVAATFLHSYLELRRLEEDSQANARPAAD